ncbi:MAG TPA: o-succinylbenzoate synthase [Chloroflexota bacterium]|nr:o-succinylbenzoate synthase [Chloroflexota bacterium]
MKIDSIELRQISLPLLSPFTTSFGTETERDALIVTIRGEGREGCGECVASLGPWYSGETLETCRHIMADFLMPLLLEADLAHPSDVWELFAPIRGNRMAKAALEMAAWDWMARLRDMSLRDLLGGTRDRVPVGVSVGIQETPGRLVEVVGQYLDQGYGRIKVKIAPGHDVRDVQAVRAAYPDILLQADANSAYTLAAAPIFEAMDGENLLLIEQPLGPDDIVDHAALQRQLATAICLDESIHSPDDARHALDLGSCRIINIKPGRVGGHMQSMAIERLCRDRGAPVWCGGMLETNIGRAHNVALASLPGFTLPGDISASARYFEHDIAGPDFVLNDDSTLSVPPGPGIGVNPIPEAMEAATQGVETYRRHGAQC